MSTKFTKSYALFFQFKYSQNQLGVKFFAIVAKCVLAENEINTILDQICFQIHAWSGLNTINMMPNK